MYSVLPSSAVVSRTSPGFGRGFLSFAAFFFFFFLVVVLAVVLAFPFEAPALFALIWLCIWVWFGWLCMLLLDWLAPLLLLICCWLFWMVWLFCCCCWLMILAMEVVEGSRLDVRLFKFIVWVVVCPCPMSMDESGFCASFLIFSAEYFRKWWRDRGNVLAGRCDK